MSKRLIDANELISAMYYYEHNEGGLTAYDAQDIINKAPTIEPKRGEWIPVKASIHPYGNDVKCSVCGHRMGSSFGYNFCPMCGASMTEREGE